MPGSVPTTRDVKISKQACFLPSLRSHSKFTLEIGEIQARRCSVLPKLGHEVMVKYRLKAKVPVHCCLSGNAP